jgi:hypothetical protein
MLYAGTYFERRCAAAFGGPAMKKIVLTLLTLAALTVSAISVHAACEGPGCAGKHGRTL